MTHSSPRRECAVQGEVRRRGYAAVRRGLPSRRRVLSGSPLTRHTLLRSYISGEGAASVSGEWLGWLEAGTTPAMRWFAQDRLGS